MCPSLREVSIDFRISARDRCAVIIPLNAALEFGTETGANGATVAICSMVLFIFCFLLSGKYRVGQALCERLCFLPEHASQAYILKQDGAATPALLRCRG